MKDTLSKIRQITENIEDIQLKTELEQLTNNVQSNYEMIQGKLNATVKQSIGRKEKLGQAYQKLNDMDNMKVKLGQYQTQISNLSKYRDKAVQEKKMYNEKIKTFFDIQLANENSKQFDKYKLIATQFDFESDEQKAYDNNRKTYQLLELAGTFGSNKLVNTAQLPKSQTKVNSSTKGR